MKTEIRTKWVNALRSNEYTQGDSVLRDGEDKFCCLGVLCDLAVKDGVIPEPTYDEENNWYRYGNEEAWLPPKVKEWAGLKTTEVTASMTDEYRIGAETYPSLTAANDEGASFEAIADFLEANDPVER